MQEIRIGKLFGYVQYNLEVPEHLKAHFANFLPIFERKIVSRIDIGNLLKYYAEKKWLCHNQEKWSYEAST